VSGFFGHVDIANNKLINTRKVELLDTPSDGVAQGAPGTPTNDLWLIFRNGRCSKWKNDDNLVEFQ